MFINISIYFSFFLYLDVLLHRSNVYLYYKLYGFYQNLYRYILSRSNIQLVGTDVKVGLY